MRPRCGLMIKGLILMLVVLVGGCSSNGSTTVSGYYEYRYGYYDPWYRHDVIVRPPARPPARPPVRPEHPIERPPSRPRPPVRPTPLPSRPMPRPAPRRMR